MTATLGGINYSGDVADRLILLVAATTALPDMVDRSFLSLYILCIYVFYHELVCAYISIVQINKAIYGNDNDMSIELKKKKSSVSH